jgi:hypothetical protein
MRLIHDHKVNPANDKIELAVLDEPGAGGACHEYKATLPNGAETAISFQNGPINEAGVNGITHEVLIAVVVDRMRDFQRGPYACRENALALTKLEEAQQWLQARTRARMVRGVEGTHTV